MIFPLFTLLLVFFLSINGQGFIKIYFYCCIILFFFCGLSDIENKVVIKEAAVAKQPEAGTV
jgi:hypothetical protein